MHITFVTHGSFDCVATLKRATGMAGPLISSGHRVSILLEDSYANRERVGMECPAVEAVYLRSGSATQERARKSRALHGLNSDLVWMCGVGYRNMVKPCRRDAIWIADHSELLSAVGNRAAIRRAIDWGFETFAFRSCDGHIAASRYLETYCHKAVQRLGRRTPVHYSPYAVTPSMVAARGTLSTDIELATTGKKVILYLGSFWENYGFWDMLHVAEQMVAGRSDLIFLFMGKGPEESAGREWISNRQLGDRVLLLGFAPEAMLGDLFSKADVFLCPLRDTAQDWARCPSKLYMYLPAGRPIVTCRIGEAAEALGERGVYYRPGDRAELRTAINTALTSANHGALIDLAAEHTWERRTRYFLDWLQAEFGERLAKIVA